METEKQTLEKQWELTSSFAKTLFTAMTQDINLRLIVDALFAQKTKTEFLAWLTDLYYEQIPPELEAEISKLAKYINALPIEDDYSYTCTLIRFHFTVEKKNFELSKA